LRIVSGAEGPRAKGGEEHVMNLLFPSHPLKRRSPDPDFEEEAAAASSAGFEVGFYSLEDLRAGDAEQAVSALAPTPSAGIGILHRGWMMTDVHYTQLCSALRKKGYTPAINPEQYAEAHYLPSAYPHLEGFTPRSAWMLGDDVDAAWDLYQGFIHEPALVKDFVKSAKHRWGDACFLPANTTPARFGEIIHAFLDARGSHFNKGLVFRRYHNLVVQQQDLRGQPVHDEYRLFFWNGELLAATPPLIGNGPFDEIAKWSAIATKFTNPFITIDLARQDDQSWLIIEAGDGGVSGLPLSISPETFYSQLLRGV
jgi:hypothetical protein